MRSSVRVRRSIIASLIPPARSRWTSRAFAARICSASPRRAEAIACSAASFSARVSRAKCREALLASLAIAVIARATSVGADASEKAEVVMTLIVWLRSDCLTARAYPFRGGRGRVGLHVQSAAIELRKEPGGDGENVRGD